MGRANHYLIFETAGGFCGIAWNSAGITRFQLPTKSATATERILLRQMPGAKTRRAHAGGGRGGRRGKALFRRR